MKLNDVVDGGSVVSGIAWITVTDVCFVCIEILYCRPHGLEHLNDLHGKTTDGISITDSIMFKRVGEHALRCSCKRPVVRRQVATRKFSVYSNPNASVASTASPLGGLTAELDRIAPRFEVSASKITILDSPSSFYEILKVSTLRNQLRMAEAKWICSTKSKMRAEEYTSRRYISARPNTSSLKS